MCSHGVSYVAVAEAARSDIENLDTLAQQLSAQMDARLELTRREVITLSLKVLLLFGTCLTQEFPLVIVVGSIVHLQIRSPSKRSGS